MKRIVDREEMRVYWQLSRWYEKTIYVVGIILTVWMVATFIIGFVTGAANL